MRTSMAASAARSLASFTGSVRLPICGPDAPVCDVEKKRGSTRSKSRSSRMRCTRTEPTIPRQPMSPICIQGFYPRMCWGSAEDLLGDRLELQVRRAFVDLPDLGVAIELLHRVVLHETVAAKEVDRQRRRALGHLRREQLAHGRGLEERLTGVAEPRGVVDQ